MQTATKNPKSKKQQKLMIAKSKNAEILLVSRSIPQQKFFSSPPQCVSSLSQAVPSTVKTSSFSSDVTQQKILYFRGREKAVQLLYSSSSAAYCLAPHTRSLPASLLASKWFSTLLSIQKEIRTDGANLTKDKTHSFGIMRAGSAAQRADLSWKSSLVSCGTVEKGGWGKKPRTQHN